MCAQAVSTFAFCQCSFGAAPCVLNATSAPKVLIENRPAATISDFVPMNNVFTFALCSSQSNPAVVAAKPSPTAPCVPAITTPWTPGQPKVLINGKPALTNDSKCVCTWGGVISIMNPATTHTQC